MNKSSPVKRYYEPFKEHKNWYVVEYYTASTTTYAGLNIVVIIENPTKKKIVRAMKKELKEWLIRYPIPLMVTAWDNKGDMYNFDNLERKHLVGFINNKGEIQSYWANEKNNESPDFNFSQEQLDNLYSNMKYITKDDYDRNKEKRNQQIKTGRFLIVVLPFIWYFIYQCILYFNKTASLVAFLIFIILTEWEAFKLLGVIPTSKKQKEKEEHEAKKNYYYHYCELNPEGFEKLKLEVLQKMDKDAIAKEAEALKSKLPEK